MLEFSVCIEMFWRDLPMDERIRRVAALGFKAFEFWGWKDKNLDAIRAAKDQTGLAMSVMCIEPNFAMTDRADGKTMVEGVVSSAAVAHSLGCSSLIVVPGNAPANESFEITRRRMVRAFKRMAQAAEEHGVWLVIEPLNPLVDHKGIWLTTLAQAADIVEEVDSPHVKILCDLYHQQVTEGNLIANLTRYAPWIGHFHAAGVPGRHELVGGELDYRAILAAIKETSYTGYVGLEFSPSIGEEAALQQALTLL